MGAEAALALRDGGHMFQEDIFKAKLTGQKGCCILILTGTGLRAAHGACIWGTETGKSLFL